MKKLVKIAYKMLCSPLIRSLENPYESQEKTLMKIIKRNKRTLFGKRHNFDKINSIETFRENVPIYTYSDYKPYIRLLKRGVKRVLTSEEVVWWAQTSGTTGEPKLVPITKTAIKDLSKASGRVLTFYVSQNNENKKVLDGKCLYFAAPAELGEVAKLPVGYISGINAINQKRIFQKMVVPSLDALNEPDWHKKYYLTAKQAIKENVTLAAGVTPLVLSLLQRIHDEYADPILADFANDFEANLTYNDPYILKKLWPNFRLMIHSGVNIDPYKNWVNALLGDIDYRELYGATEGFLALQIDEEPGMVFNIDLYFFEFIPLSDLSKEEKRRLTVDELKIGGEYVPVVTSTSGLYSYMIEDVVKVLSKDPVRIKVLGRLGNELNCCGEKVSELQLSEAIYYAMNDSNVRIREYSVTISFNRVPHYLLIIEPFTQQGDFKKLLIEFDLNLRKINSIYSQCREMGLIDSPRLLILKGGSYLRFEQDRTSKGAPLGQMKAPHIIRNSETLEKLRVEASNRNIITV